MKKLFISPLLVLICVSVNAEEAMISCSVSNQTAQVINNEIVVVGQNLEVPVDTFSAGLPVLPAPPIQLDGKKIRARYYAGSEFNKQTYLQMAIDDFNSTIYDVKPSLYQLSIEGLVFQCLVSGNKK